MQATIKKKKKPKQASRNLTQEIETLVPRFLPGQTCAKGGVEPTECVHKRVDIAPRERTLGHGNRLVCRPTRREHPLPPGIVVSIWKEISGERQRVNSKRRCRAKQGEVTRDISEWHSVPLVSP